MKEEYSEATKQNMPLDGFEPSKYLRRVYPMKEIQSDINYFREIAQQQEKAKEKCWHLKQKMMDNPPATYSDQDRKTDWQRFYKTYKYEQDRCDAATETLRCLYANLAHIPMPLRDEIEKEIDRFCVNHDLTVSFKTNLHRACKLIFVTKLYYK